MIKKKIYAKRQTLGHILYVDYSIWGVVVYRKEKHHEYRTIDYSDF